MKAEDLRIGNLVLDGEEVINIDIVSLRYMVDNKGIEIFKPIPLTEEWLLKLGFKLHSKYSYHNYILGNGFYISIWMESLPCAGFEETGVCYWGENYITIKHVHHLQNLYFALTGKELVINDGI